MNTCETCRYYMASPLQEPCESCHWDGVIGHDPPNWKGATNSDRIRSMTDEELAYFIAEPSVAPPPWCTEIPVCPHMDEDIVPCHECALDWLKEEAKE